MTPDKRRYEVHTESIHGVWSLAHEEDGTQHFDDLKRAEKLQDAQIDEGNLRQAVLVEVLPRKSVNCAGARVASKMGLMGKNVHFEGSFKVKSGPRRIV